MLPRFDAQARVVALACYVIQSIRAPMLNRFDRGVDVGAKKRSCVCAPAGAEHKKHRLTTRTVT